jgi:hypothetical protein
LAAPSHFAEAEERQEKLTLSAASLFAAALVAYGNQLRTRSSDSRLVSRSVYLFQPSRETIAPTIIVSRSSSQ